MVVPKRRNVAEERKESFYFSRLRGIEGGGGIHTRPLLFHRNHPKVRSARGGQLWTTAKGVATTAGSGWCRHFNFGKRDETVFGKRGKIGKCQRGGGRRENAQNDNEDRGTKHNADNADMEEGTKNGLSAMTSLFISWKCENFFNNASATGDAIPNWRSPHPWQSVNHY